MGRSVVGRWTLGLLVGFGLLFAGNQSEAKVNVFGLLEDMSPALCPAGGVAEFLGNIIIDDITGRVGGLAQIRASSPVTNLADCEGLLGPGLFLDGTLDITITGNIFDPLNLWKCTAFADFKIARRGPLGGLIPIQSFFGIFFVGPCDQFINMTHLDPGTLQITPGGGGGLPGLVVTIQPVPATATIGGTIGVSATVTNVGGAAAGAFRLGFYLSTDGIITTRDLFLGSCSPSGLDAGQSFTCASPLPIPTSVSPGDYLVGVIADDESVITEADESNNTAFTGPITLGLPDLAFLEFKRPSSLFLPDPPEEAEVGVPYPDYTFCQPPAAMSLLLCGGLTPLTPQTINPTGRHPPYKFNLESLRGFPPFGITLSLNGQLGGTPTVAGVSEFGVCVRDSVAKEVCLPDPFRVIVRCRLSISPTSSNEFSASGGTGLVRVGAPRNCKWRARSNESWITITSGQVGVADGTVTYSVAPNTSGLSRSGNIFIEGAPTVDAPEGLVINPQTFTVTQMGVCRTPNGNEIGEWFLDENRISGTSCWIGRIVITVDRTCPGAVVSAAATWGASASTIASSSGSATLSLFLPRHCPCLSGTFTVSVDGFDFTPVSSSCF